MISGIVIHSVLEISEARRYAAKKGLVAKHRKHVGLRHYLMRSATLNENHPR